MISPATRRKAYIALIQKRVRPGSGSHISTLQTRTTRQRVMDLRQLIRQTPFVLVGGIATRLYMPERLTLDVDILVRAEDGARLEAELTRAGAHKLSDLTIGGSSWRLPEGTVLDVIESSEPWVPPALDQPRYGPDGLPYSVLPYLVLMKLQVSRAQDIADISRMMGGADERDLEAVRAAVGTYMPDAREDLDSLIALGKLEMG
ncbi:MAG: hypothetical protein HY332_10115 [Chloroflexi bacterium]|nr:hypothetical protein [Chloroflexota bacterium]